MKLELGDLGWRSGSSAHGAAMGRTQAHQMLDGAARHARHSRLSARHAEHAATLSLGRAWLQRASAASSMAGSSSAWGEMVKGRDASLASSSGQRPANVQAVLQQTCKPAASKRASKRASSGQRLMSSSGHGGQATSAKPGWFGIWTWSERVHKFKEPDTRFYSWWAYLAQLCKFVDLRCI